MRVVDLDAKLVRETHNGRVFNFSGEFGDEVFIPARFHEWDEDSEVVTMEEWLAIEKGLV